MSFIKDTFFGGAEQEAGRVQQRSLEEAQRIIREQTEQARGEAIPLFGAAQEAARGGFQGALDIFGQTVPQQLQAFQGGNVGAQQALLAGLPQQQAAILGGQVNLGALQPQTLQLPDFSTFQQQLPETPSINEILGLNPPQPQPTGFGGIPALGGFRGFGPLLGGQGGLRRP